MDYQFRPLEHWPGKFTANRRRSPFRAKHTDTLSFLASELAHLKAKSIVIQAAIGENEIRRDGMLYAGARPAHPGIILAFESKHGPLSYPCDTYDDWQANLRAIAMSLEALRAVDRYGVTRRSEQYQGWAKLPAPQTESTMTARDAIGLLLSAAGWNGGTIVTAGLLDTLYRAACSKTHPDVGGDADMFKRVQEAKEVLDKYFARTKS